MSDILCVTSRSLCREDFLTRLERIAAAGPAGVILREKDLPPEDYRALAERALALSLIHIFQHLASLTRRYGTSCTGAADYDKKHIYVSEAKATVHEFGHFLDLSLIHI